MRAFDLRRGQRRQPVGLAFKAADAERYRT
jgi:hypothetical protein